MTGQVTDPATLVVSFAHESGAAIRDHRLEAFSDAVLLLVGLFFVFVLLYYRAFIAKTSAMTHAT